MKRYIVSVKVLDLIKNTPETANINDNIQQIAMAAYELGRKDELETCHQNYQRSWERELRIQANNSLIEELIEDLQSKIY